MTGYVGIDIGAVSATAALIVDAGDAAVRPGDLQPIDTAGDGVGPGGRLYLARYRRTRGKPLAAATDLLDEIVSAIGADNIRGVCLTGSGSQAVAGKLQAHVINEFKAVAVGLSAIGVHVRTVFEMGGETSKYLRLVLSTTPPTATAQPARGASSTSSAGGCTMTSPISARWSARPIAPPRWPDDAACSPRAT